MKEFVETISRKNRVVNTFKCGIGEIPGIEFTFKGKVQNFKLEGPGKLRIHEKKDENTQR